MVLATFHWFWVISGVYCHSVRGIVASAARRLTLGEEEKLGVKDKSLLISVRTYSHAVPEQTRGLRLSARRLPPLKIPVPPSGTMGILILFRVGDLGLEKNGWDVRWNRGCMYGDLTVIPANTQWWVTVGPPSATVGWASRGHAAHRGLISHVWSRGRHQPQKFNPDNLRLRVLERMRPHRIEDALRASCSHWGDPLETRRYCDVESTSLTLIQRRNNFVYPVGTGKPLPHISPLSCSSDSQFRFFEDKVSYQWYLPLIWGVDGWTLDASENVCGVDGNNNYYWKT